MNLYIQTDSNGNAVNHPAFEDNLVQAFGGIPAHWEAFTRIQCPDGLLTSPFQKAECTYTKNDSGVWQDSLSAVDMSEEEKANLISQTQSNPPGPNITLNVSTLEWIPNTEKPNDGKNYRWKWKDGVWVVIP
jgi:hypothetical protein